jgi:hypothetical protein
MLSRAEPISGMHGDATLFVPYCMLTKHMRARGLHCSVVARVLSHAVQVP